MRGTKAKRLRREDPQCPNPGRKGGGRNKHMVKSTRTRSTRPWRKLFTQGRENGKTRN